VPKILITSNGPESNTELENISKSLFGNSKKILIIPGLSKKSDLIIKKVRERYPNSIIFELNKDKSEYEDIDGLIFCAGCPDKILDSLKTRGFDKILSKLDVPIMTSSAGSLVIGKKCIITPDEDYPNFLIFSGLGLIPFSVEVHYDPSADKYLKGINEDIYGLFDGSGIFWDGKIRLIGKVKHIHGF
jgi:peptidase E